VASEDNGFQLWDFLQKMRPSRAIELSKDLGVYIVKTPGMPAQVPLNKKGVPILNIHSVRPARRIGTNGQQMIDLVIEMVQRYLDTDPITKLPVIYRGGCTLLINLEQQKIRYAIRKRVDNRDRIDQINAFRLSAADDSSPYAMPDESHEPFAMLHRAC
jgi:hypothetical protein